jgi:hypothetical protein
MLRLTFLVVSVVTFAGCKTDNPQSCELPENANNAECTDAGSGGRCQSSAECTDKANFPDCETMAGPHVNTCVQCTATENALCTGTTPLCKEDSCVACVNDSDCGNGTDSLCLPNGSCALLSDIAYVDGTAGMDGAPCTMSMPCTRIDVAANMKPVVKVSGTVQNRCSLNGKTTTILGESGAKLIPTGGGINDGPALEIKGASHVEVYNIEIDQATGGLVKDGSGVLVADTAEVLMARVKLFSNSVDGAHVTGGHFTCTLCNISQNADLGINVSGAQLTINQSTIRDNTNGGISIGLGGSFQIVGNVIYNNGQTNKVTGGININVDGSNANRLDFNSVSHNTAISTTGQDIKCISGIPLTANNNIVWDSGSSQPQVAGTCTYAYSDIGPNGIGTAMSNMSTLPQFQNESNGDLHLTTSSPVRRMADPGADLKGLAAYDIDGDPRPLPPLRADLGADQTQ